MPTQAAAAVSLITPVNIPTIRISPLAYHKMYYLVKNNDKEVGWLGYVDQVSNNIFLITDIIIHEQEVDSATTEIKPEAIAKLTEEMLAQPGGVDKINKLRMWGHSHHSMGVGPSGQDEKQFIEFAKNDVDYFIRGILNNKGEMALAIAFFKQNIVINNLPWELDVPCGFAGLEASIVEEVMAKVKAKVHTPFAHGGTGHYPMHFGGNDHDWAAYDSTSAPTDFRDHAYEKLYGANDKKPSVDDPPYWREWLQYRGDMDYPAFRSMLAGRNKPSSDRFKNNMEFSMSAKQLDKDLSERFKHPVFNRKKGNKKSKKVSQQIALELS